MARQWVYWATVFHRRFLRVGSANVELFIDPSANLMAEVALSAYQDGGGGARITSVNRTYGLADDYYFGDGVWRIEMSLKIVGGLDESNLSATRARMVVREHDNGSAWRMDNDWSAYKSVVYDRDSGEIAHTEEVIGPQDRVSEFRNGKLEARAFDFVKQSGMETGRLEVMPFERAPQVEPGKTMLVDPRSRQLLVAHPDHFRRATSA